MPPTDPTALAIELERWFDDLPYDARIRAAQRYRAVSPLGSLDGDLMVLTPPLERYL